MEKNVKITSVLDMSYSYCSNYLQLMMPYIDHLDNLYFVDVGSTRYMICFLDTPEENSFMVVRNNGKFMKEFLVVADENMNILKIADNSTAITFGDESISKYQLDGSFGYDLFKDYYNGKNLLFFGDVKKGQLLEFIYDMSLYPGSDEVYLNNLLNRNPNVITETNVKQFLDFFSYNSVRRHSLDEDVYRKSIKIGDTMIQYGADECATDILDDKLNKDALSKMIDLYLGRNKDVNELETAVKKYRATIL